MRTGIVALALGLLTLRWLPEVPSVGWCIAMVSVGLALLACRVWAGLYCLGLAWACWSAQAALDQRLSPLLDGQTLWLQGQVVGLPTVTAEGVRFELRGATSRRGPLPERMRLSWRGAPPLRSGEQWRLAVHLKRPDGVVNPAGFDSQAWLLSRRIGATGSIKAGERLQPARDALRDPLRQRLLAVDAQGREGGLIALVLGDGSGVSRQDWATLQATGTVHLLVISGQHIGLLAGLVYGLVAGLARSGLWPSRWPWLPWACGLAFCAALAYGVLAGFQVPVQRACIMLALVLLWRLRYRHLGLWAPFAAAFVLVLLAEPLVSLQPGFWLSFSAVAVLILVFGGRLGKWPAWRAWTRAQGCIAIGLLAPMLALGLPVSVSAPLANLFAVPWVSLVVLPPALLGTAALAVPWLGESLLWWAGGALGVLLDVLGWLAQWQPAWLPPGVSWVTLALIVVGALLVLLPAGIVLRPLGWPLLLLAWYPPPDRLPEGVVEVIHLDVGQGLAVLLRTRQHSLLYDTGPRQGEVDLGERVVVPSLRARGVRQLDRVVVSHGHQDHAGGLPSVMRHFPTATVIAGEPDGLPVEFDPQPCRSGEHWEWDGVRFSQWRWADARDSNSASCVLQVEANGERLMLSGDIEAQAEQALIASGLPLNSRWLQAGHHGSRTSSTRALLAAVDPQAVLISRGQGNGFGHPHPSVLARLQALDIQAYDTALDGALWLRLGEQGEVVRQRQQRRFWRDPPRSLP